MDLDLYLKQLEELVNIDSGSRNAAGITKVAQKLSGWYRDLGWNVETIPLGEETGPVLLITNRPSDHYDAMFIGHMDTVFPRGTIQNTPWRVENGRAYGPGCLDMKSGLVIALYAAAALGEAGFEERPVRFAFPGDEENGHRESTAAAEFRAASRGCAAVFNFETGYPDDGIVVGRKGSCRLTVRVKGVGSHAGNAPEKGRNAILEMSHKVIALQALNDLAHTRGQTLAQMALAWLLHDGTVTSVLTGASRPEQVRQNTAALNNTVFSDTELSEIDRLSRLL